MRRITLLVLTLVLSGIAASLATAQSSGGDFAITRNVIAGGGAQASGGDLSIVSTLAQPGASASASGGDFVLRSGFHVPRERAPTGDAIFSDGFEGDTP